MARLLLALLLTTHALGQDTNGDGFVTYLLPINVPQTVSGALGTRWHTELWIHNGTDQVVQLKRCGDIVPIPGTDCATRYHAAGTTGEAFEFEVYEETAPPALLYELTTPEAGTILLSSRLFELSRHAQPAGIELPVVREDEFFTAPARLIAVPSNPAFRAALRVYDPRRAGGSVRVEIIDPAGVVVAQAVLSLSPPDHPFPDTPGVAFIGDIGSAFPETRTLPHYDVRITPIGMTDFWAFVSVTDNDTQQVFLITTRQ